MKAIYKRELKSYFTSMIGCVFIAFLIAYTGIYFMVYNLTMGYPYFSYVLTGILYIFLIAVPILTMRSFAEERKSKTDQLLLTAPVSLTKIVMGKFLAMATILAIPCLVFCLFPLLIKTQGQAYFLVDYSSILAFFLLGCVFISIGMFLSSLTESQIIAAISTFGVLLLLYLWGGLLNYLPTSALSNLIGLIILATLLSLLIYQMTKSMLVSAAIEIVCVLACVITYLVKSSIFESLLVNVLGNLVLTDILTNFTQNYLFDLRGLILYISVAFVFIFLTIQTMQKRRWS